MSTKKQRLKMAEEKTEKERDRILHIMTEAEIYTPTLEPLVESYLDIYEIYQTMHIEWKEKGFPTTQRHTNKAGATNNSKHPLAQQVEVWADKKTKALDLLGLTNKGKVVAKSTSKHEQVDELAAHRAKWRNAK